MRGDAAALELGMEHVVAVGAKRVPVAESIGGNVVAFEDEDLLVGADHGSSS